MTAPESNCQLSHESREARGRDYSREDGRFRRRPLKQVTLEVVLFGIDPWSVWLCFGGISSPLYPALAPRGSTSEKENGRGPFHLQRMEPRNEAGG